MSDPLSLDELRRRCDKPLSQPTDAERKHAFDAIFESLWRDQSELAARTVGRIGTRREMEDRLREPPPENGAPFDDVLQAFEAHVAPFTMRPNHPRFWAYIPAAPTYVSILADCLCSGTNFFAGVWLEASGPAQVELIVLDWFKEFLGYPAAAQGTLTSGGSEANLLALVTARETLAWQDRQRAVLYLSDQRHWSVDRAARIAGLHPRQLRVVPADADFRWIPDQLERAMDADRRDGRLPWLVVASAGTTNTGTIDPLDELADVCERFGVWLHVDAAYGWTASLLPQGGESLAGIARADSITLDPHKWLAQTYDAGCLLVRRGALLEAAFALRPEYMHSVTPAEDEVNFADRGLALTRRFRALKIWFALKTHGVDWYRRLVEHDIALAAYAQRLLEARGFEILSPQRLSIVCFRAVCSGWSEPQLDALNLYLEDALRRSGEAMISSTRLAGKVALRFCFVHWETTAHDVEHVVDLLLALARHHQP
jgi:glutamate/tyrosine decarboxylase-like PLP-dependent enzyme